ncbi:hypothetical protein SAMN02745119_02906 [Trichlorobacter thiogenes]|uniref:BACON domain-containing protein n=1 Tax=Trichlorobacter thiogenes TaxID=115783 RepID=A0A1T4RJ10_9BACT|nr:hypothetical protein [Trichlorobacter thiogenes]SKA15982.1 hypothetical protein SAMN02745119_02906 [Trichlorobacter thiogenes]
MRIQAFVALLRVILLTLALPCLAEAVYSQPAATFSAGGGLTTSTQYSNQGIIGQVGVVGSSGSSLYSAEHGFLPVLGGWKLLYPVIAATPGTLTFTLAANASADQSLGISNSGGSTLAWTVVKNTPDTIFTLTPASGSNSGTVTVTANATGLSLGTYQNSLTISGAGISQTMLVQLDLAVSTPGLYTLRITLKLATSKKGGGTVTSTVPDSRLSCARNGGIDDVICSAEFTPGSSVTLTQTPDSNTQWGSWSAAGCASNQNCAVGVNSPLVDTAITFPYAAMATINLGSGFESLMLAYGAAAATDTIKARAVVFPAENLLLNAGKKITLLGGLDAYYLPLVGQFSTLSGTLTVGTGSLTIDRLIIK